MEKSKKRFLFTVAAIAVLIVVVIFAIPKSTWYDTALMLYPVFWKNTAIPVLPSSYRSETVNPIVVVPNEVKEPEPSKNTPRVISHDVFLGPSLYKNSEFGFEFSIPDGWLAMENPYGSPYSYFNMMLEPLNGKAYYPHPVVINIVKPEFVEMSFRDLKPSDKSISIDGLSGAKYEYAHEGGHNIDYILPRSQDTFLIGYRKGNDDIFNAIVASLKFSNRLEPQKETTSAESTSVEESVASEGLDSSGTIFLSKNKVGDVIRGMRITSIGPFSSSAGQMDLENVKVLFSGNTVITGSYNFAFSDMFGKDLISFYVTGKEREKLPRLEDDTSDSADLCLSNTDGVKKLFGPEYGHGTATLVINDYKIDRFPIGGNCDDAKFVKLISIEHDK